MNNSEIRGLTKEEILGKIVEESEALRKLRFANAITPIENPMKIRHARKLIARLNTILREKETAN